MFGWILQIILSLRLIPYRSAPTGGSDSCQICLFHKFKATARTQAPESNSTTGVSYFYNFLPFKAFYNSQYQFYAGIDLPCIGWLTASRTTIFLLLLDTLYT